jgi:3-oxoacyl-[acyl-carrier protein] reductase
VNLRLDEKVAIITGGRRGIGKAIALAMAGAGADTAIVDVPSAAEELEATAREVAGLGRRCRPLAADVTDREAVERAFQEAESALGRIDVLVNNAGITRDQLLVRMGDDDWRAVLEVNLTGAFVCIRAAAKPMIKQRSGCIINMASVVGLMGNAGQANYAAAKGGLIGLTKAAAKELAPRGIRVNAIAPGFIVSAMTDKLGAEASARLAGQIPLQRLGTPEDVAAVAVFLSSEAAAYITGQVIQVDGGMLM